MAERVIPGWNLLKQAHNYTEFPSEEPASAHSAPGMAC